MYGTFLAATTPRREPGLIVVVTPGQLIVQQVALSEAEGLAAQEMAKRLAPQLAALARAAERLGRETAA